MSLISDITQIYAKAIKACEFTLKHKLIKTNKYKLTMHFIIATV